MAGLTSQAAEQPLLPKGSSGLFYYVLSATAMAFFNRAMPTPFLPLVLVDPFGMSMSVVGLVLAAYPLGALAATSWACGVARHTQGIVRLHQTAIFLMAGAALLFGVSGELLFRDAAMLPSVLVPVVAFAALRAMQGASQAVYLAANTSLITRRFHEAVPYVVGMVEVAVGVGAQFGRITGGFLYDAGGLACPFVAVTALQIIVGLCGVSFKDVGSSSSSTAPDSAAAHDMPISMLMTPRVGVALTGILVSYFMTGLYDATLPGHLEDYVGPVSVSVVSIFSAFRNLVYLIVSYFCARLLQRGSVSFEHCIAAGAACVVLGLELVAPQPFIEALVSDVFGRWCVETAAIILTSAGNAMLFVPSLPLMQSEVRHLGQHAEEEVAILFMGAMSVGEATGPILGGWLVDQCGFTLTTGGFGVIISLLVVAAIVTYDPEVARQRRSLRGRAEGQPILDEGVPGSPVASPPLVPLDCESAYMYRRIPFALSEAGKEPCSAPSAAFRRQYSGSRAKDRVVPASVPASSNRRPFRSPPGPQPSRSRSLQSVGALPPLPPASRGSRSSSKG